MTPLAEIMSTESLVNLLDIGQLRQMRESFVSATGLCPVVRDVEGNAIGDEDPVGQTLLPAESRGLEDLACDDDHPGLLEAPITVDGVKLGSITVEWPDGSNHRSILSSEARDRLREAVDSWGGGGRDMTHLMEAVDVACDCRRTAAAQLVSTLANGIAHLCAQRLRGKQSSRELDALYELSQLLARHRDIQEVLDVAARSAAQVMRVKASSIRLLSDDGQQLVVRAVHNLSVRYVRKGPVPMDRAEISQRALAGEIVYVSDMSTDTRVLYPERAREEGLASILCAGLRFQDRPIGVIRIYTGRRRTFTDSERNLLRAIAHILATAIENARLDAEFMEAQRVQRQLQVASDVQRRMLPACLPELPPFEFAARYEPSLELSGDFYDVIDLDGHLGLVVGDVVGKGIAASLLMASVRSSLRAYAQDVYDLDEVIRRVNVQLTRDTLDREFATLYYGVLNPRARRLTYCNAGHEPALLLRDGDCRRLGRGGMTVGIDAEQAYEKDVVDLRRGDLLLLHTDGLSEAQNFDGEPFGRDRIIKALKEVSAGTAQEVVNHLFWEMRRFTGLNRNFDDTTMLVVKVNG